MSLNTDAIVPADLKNKCSIPSRECDELVAAYCEKNPTDGNFCGCSSNAQLSQPDPNLANIPVKCWAKSCTQNPRAYQFAAFADYKCPDVCIDANTITVLGSNVSNSELTQSGCSKKNEKDNTKTSATENTITTIYKFLVYSNLAYIALYLILLSLISCVALF